MLQSTQNIIRVPTLVHEIISAEYSRTSDQDSSKTVRQWLQTQSYEAQYQWGIDFLKKEGIIK